MTFVVFAGLPGAGKSLLSRRTADALGATYLRVDSIEAAIVTHLFAFDENPVGYFVAGGVAADQLRAGRSVVLDAVNAVDEAREGWNVLARDLGTTPRWVEVTCSDPIEHRRRVEQRDPEMPGHRIPSWAQVQSMAYESWTTAFDERLVIDNLGDPSAHLARIIDWVGAP